MSKNVATELAQAVSLDGSWSERPFAQWLTAKKNMLVWGLLAFCVALAALSWWFSWKGRESNREIAEASALFARLQTSALNPSEQEVAASELAKLTAILQSTPDLQPKYDGPLAETLLIAGNPSAAAPLLQRIERRVAQDKLQDFAQFAATSLLVAEGKGQEAIGKGEALLQKLNAAGGALTYPYLTAYTLARLALLYQQSGEREKEQKAWGALQEPTAWAALTSSLKTGDTLLSQYIVERKKSLHN